MASKDDAKPSRKDAERAESKLTAMAVKAAKSGDTEKAKRLAEEAGLVRKLLQGQPDKP